MLTSSRPYTFDRVIRIVFTLAIVIATLWLLDKLSGALLPFFVACLLAYIFEPFVAFNKRILHTKNNIVPIIMFLLELCGFIALFIYIMVPMIIDELVTVANLLKGYATSSESPYLPKEIHTFIREYIDLKYISSLLTKEQWIELIKNTLSGTWVVVSGSISIIVTICSWFIVLLYFIFILLDYEAFMNGIRNLVPEKYKKPVFHIIDDIKNSMNRYFRGQALIAFTVGILFCIGFLIIDMPMAIVLGMFIGLLNMVPYLQLISLAPTTILCIIYAAETGTSFWQIFLLAMIVYGVVQCIQDLYLTPKIMGKAMGLNPAIILLSLSIWGTLLGFLGLIIALPLTTLCLSYYNRYVLHQETANQAHEQEKEEDKEITP